MMLHLRDQLAVVLGAITFPQSHDTCFAAMVVPPGMM